MLEARYPYQASFFSCANNSSSLFLPIIICGKGEGQPLKKMLPFIVFVFLLLVSYQTMKQPAAVTYIESMKEHAEVASVSKDILYQEIESKSSDYEVKAQNAKIDKVWKKMPGLNGQTVNIDASYEKMKNEGHLMKSCLFSMKQNLLFIYMNLVLNPFTRDIQIKK